MNQPQVPRLFQSKSLKTKKPTPVLSQAEWQVIQKVLQAVISQTQVDQDWIEDNASAIWETCNRELPDTAENFKVLKKVLNIRDDLKAKKIKLGSIQNKVKKIAKDAV